MRTMMNNIHFPDVLNQNKELVWHKIEDYLNQLVEYPTYCRVPIKYNNLLKYHHQLVSDYPQRKGKYLRPTLVLLTAQSMGLSKEEALLTAAAMQTSEDWILCHDDIEDDSPDRRGKPTLHNLVGIELAINAADALHILMWKMINDNYRLLKFDIANKIAEEFFWMLNRTTLGQGIELKWAKEKEINLSYKDIEFILESKTGYYTIAGPMRFGAILAKANQDQLDIIYRFGILLGKAYQIIDDLLDVTSDFSGGKKIKGNDIYESKKTILLTHLLNTSNQKDRSIIGDIIRKDRNKKTTDDISVVIGLMDKYGSIQFSKELANKYVSTSKKYFLEKMDFIKVNPYRDQIFSGIEFITNRQC